MAEVRFPAVRDLVRDAIAAAPRGSKSALARSCGVTPSAVQRWADGTTAPDPDYWPAIEQHFGWRDGHLSKIAGYARRGPTPSILDRLDELEARVEALESGRDVAAVTPMRSRPTAKTSTPIAAKKGKPVRHEFPDG